MRPWALLAGAALLLACSNSGGAGNGGAGNGGAGNGGASNGGASNGGAGNGGAGASGGGAGASGGGAGGGGGTGCGRDGRGTSVRLAEGIELCLPPTVCTAETCPPSVADCVSGRCVFRGAYAGLATLPEAWATYYCTLSTGGCHGVTQLDFPEVNAQRIASALGMPLCEGASGQRCVGIAASSPMVVGNSQLAIDPATSRTVAQWGLGFSEASGLCYEVAGPGGVAVVALTDRCGGYCRCGGSGLQECGPCVSAPDMAPGCACVGPVPGAFDACCGRGCATTNQDCDWCASNNHPHFDLDTGTFQHVCGADAVQGSCRLRAVKPVTCLPPAPRWPPGGGGASCSGASFGCTASMPHQEQLPGTSCCCNWDQCPDAPGCGARPARCGAGSCACAAGQPDAQHAQVPTTGCCCLQGLAPRADGACG